MLGQPVDGLFRETFIYSSAVSPAVTASGGTTSINLLIGSDTDFECRYLTLHILQAGVIVSNFGGTINIEFAQLGKQLGNIAVPCDAVLGSGQRPYYFVPPRVFNANGTIVVTLTSNVATSTTFFIAFHGNKLFKAA